MAYELLRPADGTQLPEDEAISPVISERQRTLEHDADEITPLSEEMSPRPATPSSTPAKEEKPSASKIPTAELHRSAYIVWLVLLYAALAVFAWTVTCILTFKPITTPHYGVSFEGKHAYGWSSAIYIHSLYEKSEQYFRAARVIQSIIAVLTIPLTSAVCSKAAVIFVQRRKQRALSLRKTMVLADKGWTEPGVYLKLLTGRYKDYGSSFLLLAIALNIIGGVISPLQSIFLTTTTIKTPTFPDMVIDLTDILDQFQLSIGDDNKVPVLARTAITSTSNTDPQSRLWTEGSVECVESLNKSDLDTSGLPLSCIAGAVTLGNLSMLPHPYLAQLPVGYSTGVLRQFLLRVNSTAQREVIAEENFPANCDELPGSLYVHLARETSEYQIMTGWSNWSMIACMPANQTNSPWKPTRSRQDFSEELFLNISMTGLAQSAFDTAEERGGFFKITVNTTAGYFELPNYMNELTAGPLLEDGPADFCGADCGSQGYLSPIYDHNITSSKARRDTEGNLNITSNSTLTLEMSRNRGPLLTTALALFGEGSFLATRMARPEAYLSPNLTYEQSREIPGVGACVEQVPFMGLLNDRIGQHQIGNILDPCTDNQVYTVDDIQEQVATFVHSLYYNTNDGYGGERITNAFSSAAFLANEVWLLQSGRQTWEVEYDAGADTLVPVISRTGMILISTLLGLYLLSILVLALYSAWTPRWTAQLDSFAMMRIGAALADRIQFRVAEDGASHVDSLDRLPGSIGDATGGEGKIGELGLGASAPLKGGRKFVAYTEVEGEKKS